MTFIGAPQGNVVGPQIGVGGAPPAPQQGGALGGHAVVGVPPPPVALGLAQAGPPAPAPALPTLAAFKTATKLDGLLAQMVDVRSSELKEVDRAVGTLLPKLTNAAGMTDAAFLSAFAELKTAKADLDAALIGRASLSMPTASAGAASAEAGGGH